MSNELEQLRKQIDPLDRQIVELLNRRAQLVVQIGKLKQDHSLPVYAPDREKKVYERICGANNGPLPDKVLIAIYRELMSGSLLLEKPLRIGYLGPQGSFSHMAACGKFGTSVEYVPLADIRSVFVEVSRGHMDMGIVPVENSLGGAVIDTLDAFVELNVKICAEILLAVHHNLLANCSLEQVTSVHSKPEVFVQCRNWLSSVMKNIQTVAVASTSLAAEHAAGQTNAAAIGSILAAELYNLPVVCANIEDNPNNCTRFFVIGPVAAKRTGQDKTAIMFATAHKTGALVEVLEVLRKYGINLTNIASRPSRKQSWEYYFFADAEGHQEDQNMIDAIAGAREHCLQLSILGSFPKATETI